MSRRLSLHISTVACSARRTGAPLGFACRRCYPRRFDCTLPCIPAEPTLRMVRQSIPQLSTLQVSHLLAFSSLILSPPPSSSLCLISPLLASPWGWSMRRQRHAMWFRSARPYFATCDQPRNSHDCLARQRILCLLSPQIPATSDFAPLIISSLLTRLAPQRQRLVSLRHAVSSEPDPQTPSPLSTQAMTVRRCSSKRALLSVAHKAIRQMNDCARPSTAYVTLSSPCLQAQGWRISHNSTPLAMAISLGIRLLTLLLHRRFPRTTKTSQTNEGPFIREHFRGSRAAARR